jgi:hypothetical protein
MRLAEGIHKHGFRKWYERELLQSHAHLVLTFLCMIGVFAAVESMGGSSGWIDRLIDIAAILACAIIGIWAVRRYLYFLMHAEACANQADCPRCKAYGRFTMEQDDREGGRVQVMCRKCQQRWIIDE